MTAKKPVVQKREVIMRNAFLTDSGDVVIHEAIDYVPVEGLEEYIVDAKERWQSVTYSTEHKDSPSKGKK